MVVGTSARLKSDPDIHPIPDETTRGTEDGGRVGRGDGHPLLRTLSQRMRSLNARLPQLSALPGGPTGQFRDEDWWMW